MNDNLKYGLIGFFLGVIVTWFVALNITEIGNSNIMSANVSKQSSDAIDAHFIEQMIPHHEDAITMAKLAQTKAQRQEVKTMAEDIISAQTRENNQMKAWYKTWFGRELTTGQEVMQHHGMVSTNSSLHMGVMGTEEDLTALENAQDFDIAFVEHMIPHHQMAVMMASMLKNGTTRPEMKQLADDIITAQTNEIDLMREWLAEWKGTNE